MKNALVWIIIILAVAGGLWWYMDRSAQEEPMTVGELVVPLNEQNDSGVLGVATLTARNGSTVVELNLTGGLTDQAQPAHIHTGSCADIGGVVYPLAFPINGSSETTLDVTLDDILSQLPLALNVHKSAVEAQIYVACGDLTAQ